MWRCCAACRCLVVPSSVAVASFVIALATLLAPPAPLLALRVVLHVRLAPLLVTLAVLVLAPGLLEHVLGDGRGLRLGRRLPQLVRQALDVRETLVGVARGDAAAVRAAALVLLVLLPLLLLLFLLLLLLLARSTVAAVARFAARVRLVVLRPFPPAAARLTLAPAAFNLPPEDRRELLLRFARVAAGAATSARQLPKLPKRACSGGADAVRDRDRDLRRAVVGDDVRAAVRGRSWLGRAGGSGLVVVGVRCCAGHDDGDFRTGGAGGGAATASATGTIATGSHGSAASVVGDEAALARRVRAKQRVVERAREVERVVQLRVRRFRLCDLGGLGLARGRQRHQAPLHCVFRGH
mmetsp:Transcript_8331/g.29604  ORF Transcript_8331/g.29604 Transcript_8331/m.29604 type:complete len:353 (-) Transcript_8331:691-1749(-)